MKRILVLVFSLFTVSLSAQVQITGSAVQIGGVSSGSGDVNPGANYAIPAYPSASAALLNPSNVRTDSTQNNLLVPGAAQTGATGQQGYDVLGCGTPTAPTGSISLPSTFVGWGAPTSCSGQTTLFLPPATALTAAALFLCPVPTSATVGNQSQCTTLYATTLGSFLAAVTGCNTAGNAWVPKDEQCEPVSGGGSVDVNGSSVSSPNFNAATPAAPGGNTNCTWQVSGSSVSCYVPTSSGGSSFPFTTVQETPLICAPSSNNCVFTFPETTAASGDTDLLFCGSDGSLTLTAPSGWTLMFDQTTGTSGGHVTGYSKASASDTGATVGLGTSAAAGLMACQFMEIVGSHSFDHGAGGNGAINASPPNLVQFVTFPAITPTAGAVVYGVVSYGANRDLFTSVLTTPNWKVFGMSNDNGSFGRSIVGLASTIAATATATTPPPMPLTNSTNSVVAAGFPIAWETFSIK